MCNAKASVPDNASLDARSTGQGINAAPLLFDLASLWHTGGQRYITNVGTALENLVFFFLFMDVVMLCWHRM